MGDVEDIRSELTETLRLLRKTAEQNSTIIGMLIEENRRLRQSLSELKERKETPQRRGIEKELAKKFRHRKKAFVQHRIIEIIKTGRYSIPELKDLIVDELRYCSKATFYRYIDEIRERGLIEVREHSVMAYVE